MMIVSEIFGALQAEGSLAGTPSVFLVTIDGPARQTWCGEPENRIAVDRSFQFGAMFGYARKFWCDYAVITGGDPLHLEETDELSLLTTILRKAEHHVTIETTGAYYRDVSCDLLSINARLHNPSVPYKPSKGSPSAPHYDIEVLRLLVGKYNYQLKFEVSDPSEMQEIRNTVEEIKAERQRVLLAPAATSGKALGEQMNWIIEASRWHHYRYSPRLSLPRTPAKKIAAEK